MLCCMWMNRRNGVDESWWLGDSSVLMIVCRSVVASNSFLHDLYWWELWKDRARSRKVADALDCAVHSNRNIELSAL